MHAHTPSFNRAMEVKKKYCLELLVRRDVIGVGVGIKTVRNIETGKPCIKIYVGKKLPKPVLNSSEILPQKIEGVPTDLVEFGMPTKETRLQPAPGRGEKVRPVPIGVSVGHYALKGAGTVGGYFKDIETGEIYLMSNWHVLTNYGRGQRGDEIIQPASIDGGTKEKDTIAYLEKWIDVEMLGPVLSEAKSNLKAYLNRGKKPPINDVDVAFARPVSKDIITSTVPGIEKITGVRDPKIGNHVISIGRTSGISHGRVLDTNATVWVQYTGCGVALFDDVVLTNIKSLPGDSGAAILSRD